MAAEKPPSCTRSALAASAPSVVDALARMDDAGLVIGLQVQRADGPWDVWCQDEVSGNASGEHMGTVTLPMPSRGGDYVHAEAGTPFATFLASVTARLEAGAPCDLFHYRLTPELTPDEREYLATLPVLGFVWKEHPFYDGTLAQSEAYADFFNVVENALTNAESLAAARDAIDAAPAPPAANEWENLAKAVRRSLADAHSLEDARAELAAIRSPELSAARVAARANEEAQNEDEDNDDDDYGDEEEGVDPYLEYSNPGALRDIMTRICPVDVERATSRPKTHRIEFIVDECAMRPESPYSEDLRGFLRLLRLAPRLYCDAYASGVDEIIRAADGV